jgi:hypothetical protein
MTTKRDTYGHAAHGRASHAFERSRDGAREAANRTAETIEANPLGVLVGGLAFGAVAASLVPRSVREKELLAPVGKRLAAAAVAAIAAAKDAGRDELSALGLSKDSVQDRAQGLQGSLGRALSSAGQAALAAARSGDPQAGRGPGTVADPIPMNETA